MKKIVAMIMIVIMIAMFTGCGCGNMSMGFGNFTYEKIHVDTHNYSGCFTIEKWYDNGTGIEVLTEEAGSLFLSEGMYILVEDDCPFCSDEE